MPRWVKALRHLRQAQFRPGGEAHLQAEERGDNPESDEGSFEAGILRTSLFLKILTG
jgi:hypothetical protein